MVMLSMLSICVFTGKGKGKDAGNRQGKGEVISKERRASGRRWRKKKY